MGLDLQRNVEKLTGKSDMLGILEGITHGIRGRFVDHYNTRQKVVCKEVSLAPVRFKIRRNGRPQTFDLQFYQMLQSGAEDLPSLATDDISIHCASENFLAFLPWKIVMLLLPRRDFVMDKVNMDEIIMPCHSFTSKSSATSMPMVARRSSVVNPRLVLMSGSDFLKWGRNRKFKERFIQYDELHEVIVWKVNRSDKFPRGVLPLASIQDVLIGVQTPVVKNVRSTKLRGDTVFSIVSENRTLDLQADSVRQRDPWVSGMIIVFREFLERHRASEAHSKPCDDNCSHEDLGEPLLPRHLEKRVRKYPIHFRCAKSGLRTAV